MSAPSIGTSISDGYQRGVDRLAAYAPSVLIPAIVIAVVGGAVAQAQTHFGVSISGSGLTVEAKQSAGDRTFYNLLALLQQILLTAVSYSAIAIFAGAMHRERHGEENAVPGPAAMTDALMTTMSALFPKLGVLIALAVVGPLASMASNVLGGLVSSAAAIASTYFAVRWLYAPVIVGSGEAAREAAFTRSEEATEGHFWSHLGVLIVVGIAIFGPAAVLGGILMFVLPTAFASYFALLLIVSVASFTLWAGALDSMWAQVEADRTGLPPTGEFGTGTSTSALPSASGSTATPPPAAPRPTADTDEDSDPYA